VIIVDTNVISEMLRAKPSARDADWLSAQAVSSIFTTALTQAEVLYGIALLPSGRRQARLAEAIRPIFEVDFEGRIVPFDASAAVHFAEIAALRRKNGQPISQVDAQIAAITRSRGARLATRNQRDFIACDLELIDPCN
jgi:predicted nucleic acid-binding protein